jgi:surface antigen
MKKIPKIRETTMRQCILTFALASILVSGCGSSQTMGGILGGTVGALAGAQFGGGTGKIATTAIGTLIGAMVGSSLGARLDAADQQQMAAATNSALSTGQPIQWRNQHTGHYGTVVAEPVYYNQHHVPSRKIKYVVYAEDGRPMEVWANAYQTRDGRWHIQQ